MDEVMLEENIEVVEVMMDDDNVEQVQFAIVEVFMNGDKQVLAQVEVVSDDDNFVGVFDISPLYAIEH